MTDDTRRKPPPRFPRPGDPEVVRVTEDDAPTTERVTVPPAPPARQLQKTLSGVTLGTVKPDGKTQLEVLKGRDSSFIELSAQMSANQSALASVIAGQEMVLSLQRKQGLQIDGLGSIVNQRFDILHKEVAILRATLMGDHAPRLEAVEKTTAQKAKGAALLGGKYTIVVLIGGAVLRGVGKAFPQFGDLIEAILTGAGL